MNFRPTELDLGAIVRLGASQDFTQYLDMLQRMLDMEDQDNRRRDVSNVGQGQGRAQILEEQISLCRNAQSLLNVDRSVVKNSITDPNFGRFQSNGKWNQP